MNNLLRHIRILVLFEVLEDFIFLNDWSKSVFDALYNLPQLLHALHLDVNLQVRPADGIMVIDDIGMLEGELLELCFLFL